METIDLAALIGPLIGPARREALGRFARGQDEVLWLPYRDIKNWDGLSPLLERSGVEFADGEECILVWCSDGQHQTA